MKLTCSVESMTNFWGIKAYVSPELPTMTDIFVVTKFPFSL